MISFKQYLNEVAYKKSRTREIGAAQAIGIMQDNCMGYLRTLATEDDCIFRGGSGTANQIAIGDSNSGEARKSANTSNFYTLWMDNHPDWAKFPKRSRSFICSENRYNAEGFGDMHWIIPFDNAHIEIVPDEDLWGAFDIPHISDLDDIMSMSTIAFKNANIDSPKSYPDLVRILSAIEIKHVAEWSEPPGGRGDERMYDLLKIMKEFDAKDLFDLYREAFNPKKFKQMKAAQYKNTGNDAELAIQGECLFVPHTGWSKLGSGERQLLLAFFNKHNINSPFAPDNND